MPRAVWSRWLRRWTSWLIHDGDQYRPRFRPSVTELESRVVPATPTAVALGGGNSSVLFTTESGSTQQISPYGPSFSGGIRVAIGDVTGEPRVRAFRVRDGAMVANFLAYDPGFTGGVRVAAGTAPSGTGTVIWTGAGPGGGPRVTAFSATNFSVAVVSDQFAFDPSDTQGVYVAAGFIPNGTVWAPSLPARVPFSR
jgi:hypothetical protein